MPNEPRTPRDPHRSQGSGAHEATDARRGRREPGEQRYSNTPFAHVLTAYMWSKTPPWAVSKTAAVLGVNRTRVNNWLYYDIVPETDAMIAVMAKLGIPMSRLLDAYAEMGRPVPPLTEDEARLMYQESGPTGTASGGASEAPLPRRTIQPHTEEITVPNARGGRSGAGRAAAQIASPSPSAPASTPVAVDAGASGGGSGDEWETMVAHTRQVMASTGMPEALIDGMLAHIARIRSGAPSEAERHAAEEFAEQSPTRTSSNPSSKATPKVASTEASSDERQSRRSPRRPAGGAIESDSR